MTRKFSIIFSIFFLLTLSSINLVCAQSTCTETSTQINLPTKYSEYQINEPIGLEGETDPILQNVDLDVVLVNLETHVSEAFTITTNESGKFKHQLFQDALEPSAAQWKITVSFMGDAQYCVSTDNTIFIISDDEGMPDTQIKIPLETYILDNQIWLKGDVLAVGAIVYNADLEISLENPNGETTDTFTTSTAQMDPNDISVHGFELTILDLSVEPMSGDWTAHVTFDGGEDWPSASNSISFTIENGEETEPSTAPPEASFTLSVEPITAKAKPGDSMTYTITINADPGFDEIIYLELEVTILSEYLYYPLEPQFPPYPRVYEYTIEVPEDVPADVTAYGVLRAMSSEHEVQENVTLKISGGGIIGGIIGWILGVLNSIRNFISNLF